MQPVWWPTLGSMGNREALLEGAVRCLADKGYARTTARDIAAAAGVSLAAIGYHFRTTETLLNEAVFFGIAQWSGNLGVVLASGADGDESPAATLDQLWDRILGSFHEYRGILAASYEIMGRAESSPDIRQRLGAAIHDARDGLARLFGGIDPAQEPDRAQRVGAVYYALLGGLLTQWLVDPDNVPTGVSIAEGIQLMTPARSDK